MTAREPARRRRPGGDEVRGKPAAPSGRPAAGAHRPGVRKAAPVIRSAVEQLAELLGRRPDSVSSLRPTEDGWEVVVEVLELARIPDTTSVMGSYTVTLDPDGELISYERTRRYSRGMIDRPAG
ncbi:gas vesicle protein [Streptomyces bambusae]|uniref:gas vesicle protein GvpO n=1 Tax=Streptomyces bambusae TaxID=1550616 RepID=UPI001CFCF544|nr:gas vesicle protein [Streptomyces bambusae]MCB5164265.1 gas vesicle protein [Streptomyces bambusae]